MSVKKHAGENALTMLITLVKTALNGKVDKVEGKGLSTNDYTTEDKTKLGGVETGANKTVINNTLTSEDTTQALSAAQGKALKDALDELGYGDMLKSAYDADNDGVVDNAAALGGVAASQYAKKADLPTDNASLTNGAGYQTAQQVQSAIGSAIAATYRPQGSIAFADLPVPSAANLGYVYDVTDAFTTTAAFKEGSGKAYPAGTNVAVVQSGDSYLWDILSGFLDLTPYQLAADIQEISNQEVQTLWASVSVPA